jgi:membrane-associated protease RseP (regulator of RpoE activity)
MMSAEAEIESIRAAVAKHFSVYGVVVTPMALTFQVAPPPTGLDAPFEAVRQELVPKDYIPTVTQEKGETLLHVQRRPKARFAKRQVNLALLAVTILTTVFFGGAWNWADYSGAPILSAASIGYGSLFFSVPLLTILGCHEMGHYLVAKRYKVQASLPFFLPSLPPLGTFGAFISMRDPIPNRKALLDIGVSGPLVGFAIAIPVTLAGLALSTGAPGVSSGVAGEAIQPSVLFGFLSLFFPLPSTGSMHPLAFAGWVGLFVTAINLLPAGQLDGGHVARALLGNRQVYVSWAAVLTLFGLSISFSYPGWFLFGFLILVLGIRHPPPLNDITRLNPIRKLVGIGAVAILILTFVPQPFVAIGNERTLAFEAPAGTPITGLTWNVSLGTPVTIPFVLNHSAPAPDTVVASIQDSNLLSFGFTLLFLDYRVGTKTTTVNNSTATLTLNATAQAFFRLQVTPPSTWPVSLPQDVRFLVHATTIDETVVADLEITLHVTP